MDGQLIRRAPAQCTYGSRAGYNCQGKGAVMRNFMLAVISIGIGVGLNNVASAINRQTDLILCIKLIEVGAHSDKCTGPLPKKETPNA